MNILTRCKHWFIFHGLSNSYPNSKIISFEPANGLYLQLRKNLELNNEFIDNIVAVNMAVSNKEDLIELGYPSSQQHTRYNAEVNTLNPGLISAQASGKKLFVAKSL